MKGNTRGNLILEKTKRGEGGGRAFLLAAQVGRLELSCLAVGKERLLSSQGRSDLDLSLHSARSHVEGRCDTEGLYLLEGNSTCHASSLT